MTPDANAASEQERLRTFADIIADLANLGVPEEALAPVRAAAARILLTEAQNDR